MSCTCPKSNRSFANTENVTAHCERVSQFSEELNKIEKEFADFQHIEEINYCDYINYFNEVTRVLCTQHDNYYIEKMLSLFKTVKKRLTSKSQPKAPTFQSHLVSGSCPTVNYVNEIGTHPERSHSRNEPSSSLCNIASSSGSQSFQHRKKNISGVHNGSILLSSSGENKKRSYAHEEKAKKKSSSLSMPYQTHTDPSTRNGHRDFFDKPTKQKTIPLKTGYQLSIDLEDSQNQPKQQKTGVQSRRQYREGRQPDIKPDLQIVRNLDDRNRQTKPFGGPVRVVQDKNSPLVAHHFSKNEAPVDDSELQGAADAFLKERDSSEVRTARNTSSYFPSDSRRQNQSQKPVDTSECLNTTAENNVDAVPIHGNVSDTRNQNFNFSNGSSRQNDDSYNFSNTRDQNCSFFGGTFRQTGDSAYFPPHLCKRRNQSPEPMDTSEHIHAVEVERHRQINTIPSHGLQSPGLVSKILVQTQHDYSSGMNEQYQQSEEKVPPQPEPGADFSNARTANRTTTQQELIQEHEHARRTRSGQCAREILHRERENNNDHRYVKDAGESFNLYEHQQSEIHQSLVKSTRIDSALTLYKPQTSFNREQEEDRPTLIQPAKLSYSQATINGERDDRNRETEDRTSVISVKASEQRQMEFIRPGQTNFREIENVFKDRSSQRDEISAEFTTPVFQCNQSGPTISNEAGIYETSTNFQSVDTNAIESSKTATIDLLPNSLTTTEQNVPDEGYQVKNDRRRSRVACNFPSQQNETKPPEEEEEDKEEEEPPQPEPAEMEILDIHQHFSDDLTAESLKDCSNSSEYVKRVQGAVAKLAPLVAKFSDTNYSLDYFILDEKLMKLIELLDKLNCQNEPLALKEKIVVIGEVRALHRRLDAQVIVE